MSNLTITVDDEALKRARLRAMQQGTSLNAVLREFIASYSGVRVEQEEAVRSILALSKTAGSRRGIHTWSRNDLHERD